ncbi:hypothetical protein [Kitasatospora sp. GP82]|uniref:hypothetical protein n=1 Tax=Kitasatospora sp. GP82 TaxID=3035089 RepID=UPI0024750967|nr:hypothetical protein [Kitasatospora sp. GP82]MDH6130558.1 hypothetical protein [Kitasatospora sp. GP82]
MTGMAFVAIPGLLVVAGIAVMVWVVLRMRRLRAAWGSGITAEGRCVGVYVVTTVNSQSGTSGSAWHHIYEFTGPDGDLRRFKEVSGPATVVRGDRVVIRYPAGRPDQATAIPPDDQAKQLLITVCVLAFLTVFVTFSAFIGLKAHDMADQVADRNKSETNRSPVPPAGQPTGLPTGPPSGWSNTLPTGPPSGWSNTLPTGPPPGWSNTLPTGPPPGWSNNLPTQPPSG